MSAMPFPENLYFIALIPKRELRERITAIKHDFATRFNSKTALKVYPHITLKAPFKLPANKYDQLLNWFNNLHIQHKKFSIELKGFGAFHNKNSPVIFIKPEITNDLKMLQEKIAEAYISNISEEVNQVDIFFNPHITVAYRDLTPEMFTKAWNEYQHKKFDAFFDVDAVHLLQHDSKKWNIFATHNLNDEVAL
jgi:2'-5' RNA ligase